MDTAKGTNLWSARGERRGTGGGDDCGTAEEDGPVTREALDVQTVDTGIDGDPGILSDAPPAASGPVAGLTTEVVVTRRTCACPTGKA